MKLENSWLSHASHLCLTPPLRGTHQNFCMKHPLKTTGYCMVKIAYPNCNCFWLIQTCDRLTDRRTDDSISRSAYADSRAKTDLSFHWPYNFLAGSQPKYFHVLSDISHGKHNPMWEFCSCTPRMRLSPFAQFRPNNCLPLVPHVSYMLHCYTVLRYLLCARSHDMQWRRLREGQGGGPPPPPKNWVGTEALLSPLIFRKRYKLTH